MVRKTLCLCLFLFTGLLGVFAKGAEAAYPMLEKLFDQMPIAEHTIYPVSDQEVIRILDEAATLNINLFELIDCTYRYLSLRNMRFEMSGDSFRKAQASFNYGGHPIELLLPMEKIVKIQVGSSFTKDQKPLDIYLSSPYSVYVDIATVLYDTRCGFEKLEALTFINSYGMRIKKWTIVKTLRKIHLYEPGQAAVYVHGFFRPKRWTFSAIAKVTAEQRSPASAE